MRKRERALWTEYVRQMEEAQGRAAAREAAPALEDAGHIAG
jgi:hypothetical protein